MQARLNDVPMSHVVRQYSEIASEYPPIGEYILDVVLNAYDKPVALSGSDGARTVRDFANESYSTCVKGMREVN